MSFPYQLIDLTHTLAGQVPTWHGDCGFKQKVQLDYQDCQSTTKFRLMAMKMYAGIGTHMDAPSHCIPGGRGVHEFPLADLCMPCVVIDVSHKAHERYEVTATDIATSQISKGSCVLIKTGWEKFWHKPERYRNGHVFPAVSLEAAELLLAKEVKALGIDTLSPDRPAEDFKVHQAFLGNDKILLENVANLAKMPPIGGYVLILPLKVKDATEAPIRLVGLYKI